MIFGVVLDLPREILFLKKYKINDWFKTFGIPNLKQDNYFVPRFPTNLFLYQKLQNYISLGVTELVFPNWKSKLLFLSLHNLKDSIPKSFGSNSKNFKICYHSLD